MKVISQLLVLTGLMALGFGCGTKEETVAKCLKNLHSSNPTVQRRAIETCGEEKEPRAVPVLMALLSDCPKDTKLPVVRALGNIGTPSCVEPLVSLLQSADEDSDVRVAVVEALGRIRDRRAVEAVMDAVKDESARLTAIWALGRIGDPTAIRLLTRLLQHDDKFVRYNAMQALKNIGEAG